MGIHLLVVRIQKLIDPTRNDRNLMAQPDQLLVIVSKYPRTFIVPFPLPIQYFSEAPGSSASKLHQSNLICTAFQFVLNDGFMCDTLLVFHLMF